MAELTPDRDAKRRATEPPQRTRTASNDGAAPAAEAQKKATIATLIVRSVAACGIAFAFTTWVILPLFSEEKAESAPAVAPTSAALAPSPSAKLAGTQLTFSDLDPPRGVELAPNQGIIEIETAGADPIYVDDAFVGLGPMRRVSAPAGSHRVEVRGEHAAQPITLTLAVGRRARVQTAPAPASAASAGPAR